MRRVGVIGAGRIGAPVLRFLRRSEVWSLRAVLVRRVRAEPEFHTEPEPFLSAGCDLILDLAGPEALARLGPKALAVADLWSVSGSALADDALYRELERVGGETGHRMRVLGGAMFGLDGIAAAAEAGGCLHLRADRPGLAQDSGPVGRMARVCPGEVNFAAAAAMAGTGEASVTLADGAHRLVARSDCGFGSVTTEVRLHPLAAGRLHPVAAAVIAALRREAQVIRFG